jgi:N-acetylneuraminic acid mutarotase
MLRANQRPLFRQSDTGRLPSRRQTRFRLRLEELESRLAPASFAVNARLAISRLDSFIDTPAGTHAVVFFESSVANHQVLRQGLSADTDAVVLDSHGDGLKEMAAFLASRHNLTSIGVVAHGAPGTLALGTLMLDAASLANCTHELAVVGAALAKGGELDFWSCDVAVGPAGWALVRHLAALTGVGVAAADHAIGAAALGGSWQLDARAASAQGKLPFARHALEAFDELLGSWSGAASMATARFGHTATLLGNSKVLVMGGNQSASGDPRGALSSAELYDSASNTWSPAASMTTSRIGHTATLLANGKVLVTGGSDSSFNIISSAELYDPVNDTWSDAGSMATPRSHHTATLLSSGKVLVTGGLGANGAYLVSAELYDPASNTWSAAGSMLVARYGYTATLLKNGQVLIAGGYVSGVTGAVASGELYDPFSNTWSAASSMADGRGNHSATLLANGQVLVAGGENDSPLRDLSSAELYNSSTNTWSSAGSMATGRRFQNATLLANGQALVTGGTQGYTNVGAGYSSLSSAELYDPLSNTWSAAGSMATARSGHSATLLPNGKVLVAGGADSHYSTHTSTILSSAELYDPGAWLKVAAWLEVTGFPAAATLGVPGTFAVTAKNADGTTNFNYTSTVHFTSTDPHAILPKDYTFTTADQGVHTFSATLGTRGTQTLTVTDTKASTITGSLWHYDPDPVDPSRSTITVTPGTIPSGGTATVTLTAKNAAGTQQTSGGWPFTFDWSAAGFLNPGSGSFSNLNDNHDGTYTATFTGTTVSFPSTITITTTINGSAVPPTTITVTPAVPITQLVLTKLSPTSLTAGESVTFTVTAEDSTGTPVPSYTGMVGLTSTDGQAALGDQGLPRSYTFVPSDHGVHTFTVTLATPGKQTITISDQANNSLTATTSPITVSSPARFLVNIPSGNKIVAGNPFLLTVQAVDASGQPLPSYTGPTSVTVGSSPPDPQDTFTGTLNSSGFGYFLGNVKTAGNYALTATAGTFSGTSGNLTVMPSDATYFTLTTPAAATTGSPFEVIVTAYDHFGNVAPATPAPLRSQVATRRPQFWWAVTRSPPAQAKIMEFTPSAPRSRRAAARPSRRPTPPPPTPPSPAPVAPSPHAAWWSAPLRRPRPVSQPPSASRLFPATSASGAARWSTRFRMSHWSATRAVP